MGSMGELVRTQVHAAGCRPLELDAGKAGSLEIRVGTGLGSGFESAVG